MKRILSSAAIATLVAFGSLHVFAQQSVQQVCIGSGVHCATLNYGNIKMTFVKSPKAPGILIKEESSIAQ